MRRMLSVALLILVLSGCSGEDRAYGWIKDAEKPIGFIQVSPTPSNWYFNSYVLISADGDVYHTGDVLMTLEPGEFILRYKVSHLWYSKPERIMMSVHRDWMLACFMSKYKVTVYEGNF